ncbi:MAG: hypothetical protein HQM16_00245 [Deltaproteobacteria bacterium]|nr:hypothetical protein [Deltaproteobacteria bacterium]
MEVNNKLFLFNLQIFPHAVNLRTDEVVLTEPLEFNLTIKPFEVTLSNIISVAKATADTIHVWHQQFMEGKTRFLEHYGHHVSLRNNRLVLLIQVVALIFGVALSAFFLTANDPFDLAKNNLLLKEKNNRLEAAHNQCVDTKSKFMSELSLCQSQIKGLKK